METPLNPEVSADRLTDRLLELQKEYAAQHSEVVADYLLVRCEIANAVKKLAAAFTEKDPMEKTLAVVDAVSDVTTALTHMDITFMCALGKTTQESADAFVNVMTEHSRRFTAIVNEEVNKLPALDPTSN